MPIFNPMDHQEFDKLFQKASNIKSNSETLLRKVDLDTKTYLDQKFLIFRSFITFQFLKLACFGIFKVSLKNVFCSNYLLIKISLIPSPLKDNYNTVIYIIIMLAIFLLILSCLSLDTEGHNYGDSPTIQCSSDPKQHTQMKFKQTGPLALAVLSNLANNTIKVTDPNNKLLCTIKSNSSACIFHDSVKRVYFFCANNSSIKFKLFKPEQMQQGDVTKPQFLYLEDQEEEGIFTLKPLTPLREEPDKLLSLFWISDCFVALNEFQDHIRIAVVKTQALCGIGFKKQVAWEVFYQEFPKELKVNHRSVQYLDKGKVKSLKLPNQTGFLLSVVIENEDLEEVQRMSAKIRFDSPRSSYEIMLNSVQKNLVPLSAKIFFNQTATDLVLLCESGVFINLKLVSFENGIKVGANDILYANFTDFTYLLELQAPYELSNQSRIQVYTYDNRTPQIEICQCKDQKCTSCGEMKKIKDKFEPPCTKGFQNQESCLLKIKTKFQRQLVSWLLMLHSMNNIELQVDKHYQGSLARNALFHYMIERAVLEKATFNQLSIEVSGAKAFLTYDPECKHILCCEYEDSRGQLTLPNQRKDLKIFLQGTGDGHYSLLISTPSSQSYSLTDTTLIKSQIFQQQNTKYYTYTIKNTPKNIQILCNAPHGSLILMVNTQGGDFPLMGKSNVLSHDCYAQLNVSKLSTGKIIYIAVKRVNQKLKTDLPFSLVISLNQEIFLSYNTPFQIYYPKQGSRYFLFNIQVQKLVEFKVTAALLPNGQTINFSLIDTDKVIWKKSISSAVTTISINEQDRKKICKSLKECKGKIEILNNAEIGLDIDVLLWEKSQPMLLIEGIFQNFETGSIGQTTTFFIDVRDTLKPINIYAESNEVKIQLKISLYSSKEGQSVEDWPFPQFNEEDKTKQLGFSSGFSLGLEELNKQFKNGGGIILISIRDISPKTPTNISTQGSVTIVYCTDHILLQEGYKISYSIFGDHTFSIYYNLENVLVSQSSQQIYFHNTHLVGKATVEAYLTENTKTVSVLQLGNEDKEVMIIKEQNFKKFINSSANKEDFFLRFVVSGEGYGRFLANVIESNSQYRQLSLGTPEDFHIKIGDYSIFEFLNFYNQGFKIKISRKQGFPSFKIKSCKEDEQQKACIKDLQNNASKYDSDPDHLITNKKSHELQFNKSSKDVCNNCRYYIRLDALNQDVDGSLTVLRPGEPILLIQGRTSTTEIEFKDHDIYKVVPGQDGHITIMLHNGYVSVIVYNENKTLLHMLGDHSSNIEIDLPADKSTYFVDITPLEETNIVYSIVYTTEERSIYLEDGVPLRVTKQSNKISYFEYIPMTDSSLVVTSDEEVKIDIFCSIDNKTSLASKTSIQNSRIINMSVLYLSVDLCSRFMISVANDKRATYSMLINDKDTILVRPWIPLPNKISKNKSNLYEFPVQFDSTIKIVFRFCQSIPIKVGLTTLKAKIYNQSFDPVYNIPADQGFYSIQREVKPGVLYISVSTHREQIMDYTFYMYAFQNRAAANAITADILDSFIQVEYKDNYGKSFNYNITFSPLQIHHRDFNHTVKYIILQSPTRTNIKNTLRCDGFVTSDIKQTQLKVNVGRDNKLWSIYPSKQASAYITIVPQVDPMLPGWSNYQTYQIVQLSNALGPIPVQRFITSLLTLIQNLTSVSDAQTLNFILFILIFALNMICICICCFVFACYSRRVLNLRGRRIPNTEQEASQVRAPTANDIEMLDPEDKP